MSDLFRPISMYREIPPATFDGADSYVASVPPVAQWPNRYGGTARNSCSAEPLPRGRWAVHLQIPLGEAERPQCLLVGMGMIFVQGRERTGIWAQDGRLLGLARCAPNALFLDAVGQRLLGDDLEGGLSVFALRSSQHGPTTQEANPAAVGAREASLAFGAPAVHTTRDVFSGPGSLVLVTANDSPFVGERVIVVEAIRVRDYDDRKNGMLYGIEPLAGMRRVEGGRFCAALARTGPVLATRDGILWCDWQLGDLALQPGTGSPLALSIDVWDRAHLVAKDKAGLTYHVIGRDGSVGHGLTLDWSPAQAATPPILDLEGYAYLTPQDRVLAIGPNGDVLWHQFRDGKAPATVTADGVLLLPDSSLSAVTRDGKRWPLWYPPAPLVTSPVLCGGLLHVCTSDTLFVLRPQP